MRQFGGSVPRAGNRESEVSRVRVEPEGPGCDSNRHPSCDSGQVTAGFLALRRPIRVK